MDRPAVQSVGRALNLLERIVEADRELGLRELSVASDLAVATVHRLLTVLTELGYVRRNPVTRRYGVGHRAFSLASAIRRQGGLRDKSLPFLRELMVLTQESANLAVLDGDQITYLAQVQPPRLVRMFTQVGNHGPLHATGTGKAILAHLPDAERARLIARLTLARFTARTITQPPELEAELDRVRSRGYALDEGEFEEAVHCLAVPVFDAARHVIAALSVSGPMGRVTPERLVLWMPRLKRVATELSRGL